MIGDHPVLQRRLRLRHEPARRDESRQPVDLPGGRGEQRGRELAALAGPEVERRRGDGDRPRRHERHELMLVERQLHLLAGEPAVVLAEPVRELPVDGVDVLGERQVHVMELRPRAAGVVHAGEREARIRHARPQRGLAAARMADHRDALRVELALRQQPVQNPARAPRPGADRAPVAVGPLRVGRRPPRLEDARLEAVGRAVDRDVPVVEHHRRVAALENLTHREVMTARLLVIRIEPVLPDPLAEVDEHERAEVPPALRKVCVRREGERCPRPVRVDAHRAVNRLPAHDLAVGRRLEPQRRRTLHPADAVHVLAEHPQHRPAVGLERDRIQCRNVHRSDDLGRCRKRDRDDGEEDAARNHFAGSRGERAERISSRKRGSSVIRSGWN